MLRFPEPFRIAGSYGAPGAFKLDFESRELWIIASNEFDWDHVSVSLKTRIPNWREMSLVKEVFWDDQDWVIQYHPPKKDYINLHPFCLHLWRPQFESIPLPPTIMV